MKKSIQNEVMILMLAGMAFFSSGCTSGLTTSLVWRVNQYHPADVPRLSLATVPQKDDVLVGYDECFAKSKEVRPRAYWLLEYSAKGTNALRCLKPEFVDVAGCTNLAAVPFLKAAESPLMNSYSALPATNQLSFTLWRNGALLGNYRLPIYTNAPPVTFGRVALTPITAITDTAIVTLMIGACGLGAAAH